LPWLLWLMLFSDLETSGGHHFEQDSTVLVLACLSVDSAPLLITLGLLYPVAAMITYIVREKELRQKELMKMMSVMESDIGWSWFCTFAIMHVISASCCAAVATVLYDRSSLFLLWLFWSFGFLAIIVFSMAWSTITSRSARAVLVGLLVFFSGIFLTLAVNYESGNPTAISIVSLHPVTAFVYGIKLLGHLEDLDLGLVGNTLDYTESLSGLRMIDIYRYLVVDTFLWSFLSWYLNRVIEPEYGQALPLWFLFNPNYWCGVMFQNYGNFDDTIEEAKPSDDSIPSEPVSDALKRQAEQGKSLEIVNLRKTYGNTIAVDGISLSMYSGQVTALLGHNGMCSICCGALCVAVAALPSDSRIRCICLVCQALEKRLPLGC
jgi:ATP-binding cassette, subfamily A (ABC1), member 3